HLYRRSPGIEADGHPRPPRRPDSPLQGSDGAAWISPVAAAGDYRRADYRSVPDDGRPDRHPHGGDSGTVWRRILQTSYREALVSDAADAGAVVSGVQ